MKIISLLGEAYKENKANLPIDKDLLYKARQKYPQYSGEQALTLYIADEMKEKDKIDNNQNRLIDTQKRENERLRGAVQSLGQELQDFEQQSIETDREVTRLKQLSGTLTSGGAETQQKAKVSANDLEKLQKDLETLKSKPGMDPKVFDELTSQVKILSTNKSTDNDDVKKLQNIVKDIENQASVNYNAVAKELKSTKDRLAAKEQRFKEYKTSFSDYKKSTSDKIKQFDKEFQISRELRAGIQQDAQDISNMKDELQAQLDLINDVTSKITRQQVAPMASNAQNAQNDPTIEPKSGSAPNADVLGSLAKGPEAEKNITKDAEKMLNRKLAEGMQEKQIKPLQKYGNK
jgi:DNA repair exonuclease SbcCD ATPase subunit